MSAALSLEMSTDETTCEVCGHVAAKRHPCRFERACSCWYGVPCNGTGAKYRAPKRKP
jgi:hypothetical protein